jgi:hypothetical protein
MREAKSSAIVIWMTRGFALWWAVRFLITMATLLYSWGIGNDDIRTRYNVNGRGILSPF